MATVFPSPSQLTKPRASNFPLSLLNHNFLQYNYHINNRRYTSPHAATNDEQFHQTKPSRHIDAERLGLLTRRLTTTKPLLIRPLRQQTSLGLARTVSLRPGHANGSRPHDRRRRNVTVFIFSGQTDRQRATTVHGRGTTSAWRR